MPGKQNAETNLFSASTSVSYLEKDAPSRVPTLAG